jgi:osmotically-inducible protein OsmY
MKIFIAIIISCLISSCAEAVIGGIGASAVFFSKNDYTIFSSKMVYDAKREVSNLLQDNHHSSKSVSIVQSRDTVYVIGVVKSAIVKGRIISVLDKIFNKHYVDEIIINADGRSRIKDAYIKAKIRNKLLFTRYTKSQNYQVLVYNQKAYIIGIASSQPEKEIVINTLSQIEYIDDIVAYIT